MRYIKKIILENFQSHKYSVIELNEELNVIVGPSDSGKSAIIRGLKWVLYNEPAGDYFIREGEREASVTVEFSDNIKVKRYRSKSKNSYHLFNRDGEEMVYEGFGTNVPDEIMEQMDIKKIHLDSDESVSINLGEQLDGAFLLSEKTSVRASAIGRLVGVNVIDDALREGLKDNRNISIIRKNLDTTIIEIENQLEKYDYLSSLQQKINKIENIRLLIIEKENKVNKLNLLLDKFVKTNNMIEESNKYIHKFKHIEVAKNIILKIEQYYKNYKFFTTKKQVYDNVKRNIIQESNIVNNLQHLETTEEKFNLLSELSIKAVKFNKINTLITKHNSETNLLNTTVDNLKHIEDVENKNTLIESNLAKLDKIIKNNVIYEGNKNNLEKGKEYIKNFQHIDKSNDNLNNILIKNNKLIKFENIMDKYKVSSREIIKTKEELMNIEKVLEEKIDKYGELLSKQQICPFCLSHIDEDRVSHIKQHYK